MYVLELALEAENQDKMGREEKGWGEMLKMLFSTDRGSHGMSEPQHHPTEKMQPGEGERPAQRHTAMPSEAFPPIGASELAADPGGSHHHPSQ